MKFLPILMIASLTLAGCGGSSKSKGSGDKSPVSEAEVQAMNDALAAVNEAHADLQALQAAPQKVPFMARLNEGQSVKVATQGALSLYASCQEVEVENDEGDFPPPPPLPPVQPLAESAPVETYIEPQLLVTTSVDGAVLNVHNQYLTTGVNYIVLALSSERLTTASNIDQTAITAPTGDSIVVNGETVLFGRGVQGSDCVIAGLAVTMKGADASSFTFEQLDTDNNQYEEEE